MMPREDRPAHQLFDKCAKCGEEFKAGDSVWISIENEPLCKKCALRDVAPRHRLIEHVSYVDWFTKGARLFGPNTIDWKFVCPVCGNVAAIGDFQQYAARGSTPNSATCECIGRYTGEKPTVDAKPCDYAGYGLFKISPIRVTLGNGKIAHSFAFAEPE